MKKPLSEMSNEELWQLFPIILSPHSDEWAVWYADEEAVLRGLLGYSVKIDHIGSTSVSGIYAKPTVDILIQLPHDSDINSAKSTLLSNGYTLMCDEGTRISFNKGYTPEGFAERVFHLHLRFFGDNDEIYFRDYLRENPKIAKQYEKLKLALKERFEHNRNEYTNAKTEFIREHTDKAKTVFKGRYD